MKQIFFIIAMLTFTSVVMAQRSQEAFSLTIKTSSEVRATNAIESLSKEITLTSEQKEDLRDIVRYYLDEYQNLLERANAEEAIVKLNAYRDKMAKKILKNEEYFLKFNSQMEEVRRMYGNGYGRR